MPEPLLPAKPPCSETTRIEASPFEFVGVITATGDYEGWVYLGTEVVYHRWGIPSEHPDLADFVGYLRKIFARQLAAVI